MIEELHTDKQVRQGWTKVHYVYSFGFDYRGWKEIRQWCDAFQSENKYYIDGRNIWFQNEQDALVFRLWFTQGK
jgi:hypothetical protein